MNADYLAAKPEGVHALARDGSPAAEEERAALIGAMAGLGLPEGHYLRDPSRPRSALYLYRGAGRRYDIGRAPWRMARQAPPGMRPADVSRVGRELRSGLLRSASALAAVLVAALCCDVLAPSATQPGLSPAAYLQATPAILGCVAVLCALGTVWHLLAFLFPRAALLSDFEGREAWEDTLGNAHRAAAHRAPSDGR